MLAITGDTYEIRDQLKAMGCSWCEQSRCWVAPDEGARANAQALADAEPWRQWCVFMGTLAWVPGAFTNTVWDAGLRACSIGVPMADAIAEIGKRIESGGGKADAAWLQRNVGRAYETAEPPKRNVPAAQGKAPVTVPVAKEKPKYEPTKLSKFAAPMMDIVDAAWLADRSPIDPVSTTADGFLRALYRPGEHVVVLDVFKSQGQWLWSWERGFVACQIDWHAWDGNDPHHEAAPPLKAGRSFSAQGPQGIWYLTNPVCGEWKRTSETDTHGRPRWSRRSEPEITAWRYFTLESDIEGISKQWVAAMVQLPLKIAAIYTSGGKSVHVLVRVDASSKAELDLWRQTALRTITILGGDPANMTAVRLSRLPACWRLCDKDEKPYARPRHQRLLYLASEPSDKPICERAPVRDSLGTLGRMVAALGAIPRDELRAEDLQFVKHGLARFAGCAKATELRAAVARLEGAL